MHGRLPGPYRLQNSRVAWSMQPRMTTSRPLRLVQQAAQPIEFSCPFCGSMHAAYIFGTDLFRAFRCGGCALTFSKKATRTNERPLPAETATVTGAYRKRRANVG